jgi:hypothetical protein
VQVSGGLKAVDNAVVKARRGRRRYGARGDVVRSQLLGRLHTAVGLRLPNRRETNTAKSQLDLAEALITTGARRAGLHSQNALDTSVERGRRAPRCRRQAAAGLLRN